MPCFIINIWVRSQNNLRLSWYSLYFNEKRMRQDSQNTVTGPPPPTYFSSHQSPPVHSHWNSLSLDICIGHQNDLYRAAGSYQVVLRQVTWRKKNNTFLEINWHLLSFMLSRWYVHILITVLYRVKEVTASEEMQFLENHVTHQRCNISDEGCYIQNCIELAEQDK